MLLTDSSEFVMPVVLNDPLESEKSANDAGTKLTWKTCLGL